MSVLPNRYPLVGTPERRCARPPMWPLGRNARWWKVGKGHGFRRLGAHSAPRPASGGSVSSESVASTTTADRDTARLESLGYRQELSRVLGFFDNFSVAFTYL